MQQVDDPPSLPVGTEVSAKYKGAFCEAKVSKVVRNIKVKVAYKQGLGSGIVSDDAIKAGPGQLRVGANVEVRHPDRKEPVEATVTKIQDCSQYTVVFDDGDITTLRRTALCLKSGRHFNESETLDQLPLTHPEHFGNPVVGGRRGRRRGQMNEDSSEEEDESDTKEVVNEKEEHIGKVVCIETESKKKDKEKWFPGLVVAPTAQATVRIRVKDEYLVRSFKDFRYYTVPKKEATEFTREAAAKQDGPAVQAALEYLDSDILPLHWDRDALFGLSQNSSSEDEREVDSDSSDDEPREEKDHFVAQLYKYMDDRGTPLNRVPTIQNRDVDLYRLFRAVQKRGGYNRITAQNQWKSIAMRLGFTPVTVCVSNLVKQAYKKFLQPYCEFHRKLGCSMLMTPRNSNRSKGRSLVRANSVASPKLVDNSKEIPTPTIKSNTNSNTNSSAASTQNSPTVVSAPITPVVATTQSAAEESENTSESSLETHKNKRKSSLTSIGGGKVKALAEKYEEKTIKDDCDVPLSKMKAAAASARAEEKEKDKDSKDNGSSKDTEEHARDSSPTGAAVAAKKEKFQKKSTPQTDDKRGKRKRDEVSVEKVDAGDFVVEIGDKLKVYYDEKKGLVTYEAKVIEISPQRNPSMYLVHYTGWNNRYDEWVPRERIAENLSKGVKQKSRSASAGGSCSSSLSVNADKQRDNINKQSAIMPSSSSSGGAGPSNVNPSNMATLSSGSVSSSSGNITASMKSSANISANKRGRGRSDSLPPRSTTPSSVASNSSRTKSPASSSVKKRPTRNISSTIRRTSANVSDVSIPTESETDSDEPVRRPPRAAKETSYKNSTVANKAAAKRKAQSVSAANSPSDTEDDDDEEVASTSQSRALSAASSRAEGSAKGRDYDLNQIRSELKGLQGLKSPSPTGANGATVETKDGIKTEHSAEFKVSPGVLASTATPKEELKPDIKEETIKSSTDLSSETDSYGDDDSQSSGKTTKLENMTKKLQQKINADKQRALEPIVEKILAEKRQESLKAKPVVIKEEAKSNALAKSGADIVVTTSKTSGADSGKTNASSGDAKEEHKSSIGSAVSSCASGAASAEGKSVSSIIAPARFGVGSTGATMATVNTSKYTSVIVEKPLSAGCKKGEASSAKKAAADATAFKKTTDHLPPGGSGGGGVGGGGAQMKKFVEPVYKEILKVEPPAACSPSSSSSSSSSSSLSSTASASASASSSVTITSISTASTRSLPDMSKLDISGNSSSSSANTLFTSKATEVCTKAGAHIASSSGTGGGSSSITATAATAVAKSVSPDIYEFKDPEPFEFEIRKSPMVTAGGGGGGSSSYASSSCTNSTTTCTASSSSGSGNSNINTTIGPTSGVGGLRKQNAKLMGATAASIANASNVEHGVSSGGTAVSNPLATLIGRKKRGSPMKELNTTDKSSKAKKIEEHKPMTPLVAEAKLTHHPQPHTSPLASASASTSTPSALAGPVAQGTQSQSKTAGIIFASPITVAPSDSAGGGIGGSGSIAYASTVKTKECSGDSKVGSSTGSGGFSVFDVLRKTPSSNLNINALNEELAQTVQETTRALTDAQQPGETTPTKVELKSPLLLTATGRASPKAPSTPTTNTAATKLPVTVGSPFIETRKDLSNVFELSFGEGLGGSGEPRENRFELENAKILLSATTAGFDLMPAKLEHSNKPTSIADKVLKAISQKKEEVENKHKEREAKLEIEKSAPTDITIGAVSGGSAATMPAEVSMGVCVSVVTLADVAKSAAAATAGALLDKRSQDLIVTAELDGKSLIGTGVTSAFAKPTTAISSGSPESKVGILESINAKNNDLSETIQKLECAIQRKTPVPSLSAAATTVTPLAGSSNATTPVGAVASVNYSDDDSMDSTDSERRLVIEDADDTTGASPTVAVGGGGDAKIMSGGKQASAHKLAVPSGVAATAVAGGGLQAPIPLKVIGGARGGASYAVPPAIVGKVPNSLMLLATGKDQGNQGQQHQQQQQQQLHLSPVAHQATSVIQGGHVMGLMPLEVKKDDTVLPIMAPAGAIKLFSPKLSSHRQQTSQQLHAEPQAPNQLQQQQQRTVNTVVPILVPDIPVSVVVAPHATPTAKQLQSLNVKSIVHTSGTGALVMNNGPNAPPVSTQSKGFDVGASGSGGVGRNTPVVSGSAAIATSKQNIAAATHHTGSVDGAASATCGSASGSGSSGFYLQSRADLRPDDGVKPIGDVRNSPGGAGVSCFAEALDTSTSAGNDFGSAGSSGGNSSVTTIPVASDAPVSDSAISLLCEETIPGSPAPATSSSRDDVVPSRVGSKQAVPTEGGDTKAPATDTNTPGPLLTSTVINSSSGSSGIDAVNSVIGAGSSGGGGNIMNTISSPNDSASQDDSGDELQKKCLDVENEVSPRKRRRRTRKQSEIIASLPEQQLQPSKRRRPIVCNKKNTTAGSESDDNSDAISQRSTVSGRQQQQMIQLQTQTTSASGIRPCPYNFLVQLNPSLGSEKCIAILLKQIQELRKTYNMIKSDLAGIDRRRKKLRRREREKKQQQLQNQQQIKIGT